ncbi:MAG TPA: MarR family transcriptional regulator [Acidimicrobiia bacterium]|nr:MarR family transcriptional regulator [Acidimicrobiia bacterium]
MRSATTARTLPEKAQDATRDDARDQVLVELVGLAPLLERLRTDALRRRRLTQARARLLNVLAESGPLVMSDLSRALDVTPRAVTGLVDALERDGLARRVGHPSDRRATFVELTPSGRRLTRDFRTGLLRFADELLGDVRDQDVRASVRVLRHVRAVLESRA